MKRRIYMTKKDQIVLIVAASLLGLLIVLSIVSGFILSSADKKAQNTSSESSSAVSQSSESTDETQESTSQGTTTVTSVGVEDVSDEKSKAEQSGYDDLSVDEITSILEESDWEGYLRPDHTNEEYWSLDIDGNDWTIVYDDGETSKEYEYEVKITGVNSGGSVLYPTYNLGMSVEHDGDKDTTTITFLYDPYDEEFVLNTESPFACSGFRTDA